MLSSARLSWNSSTDTLVLVLQARRAKRQVIFKRADQYVKEYTNREKEEVRLRREARASGDFYVPAQPKVRLEVYHHSGMLDKLLTYSLSGLLRRPYPRYQRACPQAPQDPAAPQAPPDQQRCLRQGHQGVSWLTRTLRPNISPDFSPTVPSRCSGENEMQLFERASPWRRLQSLTLCPFPRRPHSSFGLFRRCSRA